MRRCKQPCSWRCLPVHTRGGGLTNEAHWNWAQVSVNTPSTIESPLTWSLPVYCKHSLVVVLVLHSYLAEGLEVLREQETGLHTGGQLSRLYRQHNTRTTQQQHNRQSCALINYYRMLSWFSHTYSLYEYFCAWSLPNKLFSMNDAY